MAKMKTSGLDTFDKHLNLLAKDISRINKKSLYEGAGVVADSIKDALDGLPDKQGNGTEKSPFYGATDSEKQQIIANFGVSRFRYANGATETSIGFTGYVNTHSERFNDKIPTGMLMQAIEYASTCRQGTHTITRARRGLKDKFLKAVEDTQTEEINKIMK